MEMADSEKTYALKKQLRKLEGFRGSGTELISVYIPSGSPIHEMGNKLREEMSQASNIKSKSTKLNVLGALEKVMNYLKIYRKTPPNGIAVFAGNVSDNAAKVDIELFAVEPPEPLNIGAYRCDSRFFLEPLQAQLGAVDAYGVVVLDGREATVAIVKGTNITIIKKLNSTAHAKIRKGGQCLAAGTLLMGGDGRITGIEASGTESTPVGLDFQSAKTIPVVASDFFVTPAKHSLIIRTRHPLCEIRATPYHRFFVISEHGIKEKFTKDLDEKDRILIAKKLNCHGRRMQIGYAPDTRIVLDEKERSRLRNARLKLGIPQKTAAQKVGLSQMMISHLENGGETPSDANLRRIYGMYGLALDEKCLGKKTIDLPVFWNESLARLCGVLCGDGTADGNRTIIYEGSKELAGAYCRLVETATGIEPTLRTVDKTGQRGSFAKKPYYEIRIYSLEFAEAIAQIAPGILAAERDIPADIAGCDDSIVAAFLSGLYDAEGYMHGNRVDIAMTSRMLMKKVQLLLLRFGILSSFAEKKVSGNNQWFVSICDRNSLRRFRTCIGFTRSDKKKKLDQVCARPGGQQYIDQIPIDGREVFRLAGELGLKTTDFHAASCFFRNRKPLGREAFARNILSVFDRHRNTERGRKAAAYLHRIYDSDFTFATMKEKIPVESRENFYDMTIPVHSNFIADGFVVHNSARRYERLIEEAIEVYYKRVGVAMDAAFVNKVKGVIVGGPGPTKEFFIKMSPFNYQIKVLGVVDTGYTEEYGIREALSKSENIIANQEAVKEKVLVDRFIKAVVNEGLAIYGEKDTRAAIISRQAEQVLLSEGLEYTSGLFKCPSCGTETRKAFRDKPDDTIACPNCSSQAKLQSSELLLDELAELAKQGEIPVEILSTNTAEGAQFLTGFGGIGAFLRYKTR
jgi:peptide subunit release factor 1 (eRF1)/transcriptional regulator with XRE-family HTH domain